MKTKHNKKRNTAFVYEALIKEATLSIIKGDTARKQSVVNIIKKHFGARSLLRKDLECYRSLYENQELTKETSERILREAKMQKMLVDPAGLFAAQSAMIRDVNKDKLLLNTFVSKFNDKYRENLREEQQQLLSNYISSFVDNSLSLKMYLNEEITRLKQELVRAPTTECFAGDTTMVQKANQVVEKLNQFAREPISDAVLLTVLKAQELVGEIYSDGTDD